MDNNVFGRPIDRRVALKWGLGGVAMLGLAACGSNGKSSPGGPSSAATGSVSVPTNAAFDDLVKAAQKEGSVTMYSAASPGATGLLTGGFTGKYGIPVKVTRLVSEPLETRVTAEIQAGKPVADIIQLSDSAWLTNTATKQGWLATPKPSDVPAVSTWPAKYVINKQAYLQAMGLFDIVHNTELVTGSDVPQQWKDVLNPKLKGKIMLPDPRSNNADLAFFYFLGKLYGDSFLQQLGDLKPQLTMSTVTGVNSVASGDAWLMLPTNHWSNTDLIAAGAPIQDTYPTPTTAAEEWMAMVAHSPHPNAAKLFFNWALSSEGQQTECGKMLCTSVLNVPGSIPFPSDYSSPPVNEATADRAHILGLLGLS